MALLKDRVFEYISENPDASENDLRNYFSDVRFSSLSAALKSLVRECKIEEIPKKYRPAEITPDSSESLESPA